MSRQYARYLQDENRGAVGGRPKVGAADVRARPALGTITNGAARLPGHGGAQGVRHLTGATRTYLPTRAPAARSTTTAAGAAGSMSARSRPTVPTSARDRLAPRTAERPAIHRADVERITEDTRSPHMDARHHGNVMRVPDLTHDIFEHLRNMEGKHLSDPNFMARQTEINEKMRSILVDWIVDVCKEFKLLPDTFYLAINIIDRYLSKKNIARSKLQLLGVTAMLLASKYEEMYAPEVRDFVYISARAYLRDEILRFERHVVATIQFNLTVTTCHHFADRFCQAAGANARQAAVAAYLMHAAQHNYALAMRFLPSVVAASSVYLARKYLGIPSVWTPELEHYTRYKADALQEAVRLLNGQVRTMQTSRLRALSLKFSRDDIASFAMARASALTDL